MKTIERFLSSRRLQLSFIYYIIPILYMGIMMQNRFFDFFLSIIKSRKLLHLGAFLGFLLVVGATLVHGIIPFAFWKVSNAGPPTFTINGVTGGSDSTQDAWLANGTNPTVYFATLAGSTGYDVVIKDSAGVVTKCSSLNQAASPVSPSSCGLVNGTTYKIYLKALPSNLVAYNDGMSFTVDNTAPTTNTITGITGASDAVVDTWLTGGLNAKVNWNAFTNAGSYDVTIKDSAGTTTVCATQNTTSTFYDFSSCTLTDATAYKAYVTAKSAAGFQTTNASNTGLSFTVDNTAPGSFSITGISGGSDVLVDAYLSNGDDPTVTYSTSANVYRYDLVIKDSTDTTTVCSLSNQTGSPSAVTCTLTNGLTYKAHVTAKSISTYLTTVASNDGFSFTLAEPPPTPPAGNFTITGATGGSDTTADSWLTSGTTVTANWNAASGAQNYSVTIRNSADSADVCSTQVTASTSYTFTGCTLSNATTYLIKVLANNSPAAPTTAMNSTYPFTVTAAAPGSFSITGATGGADSAADDALMNGTIVTANWNSSSGASTYDVTIRNSGDSADVCATQNTASTSYTFTGCTLTANTTYTIKVVAKSGALSTPAYNSPFSFLVPNAITFCPTGSSTAKALVIYDSGGAGGNYVGSQNCNFTISPPATATSIVLNFTTFDSNDNGDVFTAYDGTTTGGTLLGTYKNTSTAPPNLTATSGNMYLTWVSGSANHAAGYDMNYKATYAAAGSFNITGVKGGADTTADTGLTDNSSGVTVDWGASANASSYDVTIRNGANTNDVCAKINTASTSYNFASCTGLVLGTNYVAAVYAKNANGLPTAASNSPFSFIYTNRPVSFTITGATGGADTTADSLLEVGTTVTANWTASANHTSYDVTIFEDDGITQKCATTNVGSGSTSYTFTGCTLVSNQPYKIEVIAKNANGSTLATNSPFNFSVQAAWTPTSLTSAPSARQNHTAVWTGSEMVIWGGVNGSTYPQAGAKYNPTTDSWVATALGPVGRYFHAAVWTGTEMIVWGGYNPTIQTYYNNGGRYNPSSNSWTTSIFTIFTERKQHTAIWTGTEMIVWGGTSGGNLNTGGKYNPSTDSWTVTGTGTNVPVGRYDHTAIWTDTEMIVWGGTSGSALNTGGKYNPSTNAWTTTSTGTNVPGTRMNHTAIWTGTEMIVWGGSGGGVSNAGGKYNPSTDAWTATSTGTNVPAYRNNHTAIWTGTEMIVWGGTWGGVYLDTGGKYNPSTDAWTTTSTGTNLPAGRSSHTAIWTGTEMVVWGGSTSGGVTNTGGKYNPSTDAWTATSTGTNVPVARFGQTAIWTNTEMIVWGGSNGTSAVNTGGKYNPSTNAWTTTSTGTDVPALRIEHTAVWTGTEMIVWGGSAGNKNHSSGGKYNPSTDAWTATSTGANVPVARQQHIAVWTGTEMVVWGGSPSGSYLNTGGKYNPSTDSWTATSTGANVPTGRNSHTAIWTGTEMIVWGGFNGSANLNTGGKYNPSTDSWTATSTGTNVPSIRAQHTAIWTDTEMIVWGGQNSGSSYNTGGKYNPSTDSWTATSTGTNVPSTRTLFTAVWTGTEMIIWGGHSGGKVNTGGKYNPATDSWTATSTGTNVPAARGDHTAIWTDSKMIIWGGYTGSSVINSGSVYIPF